MNAPSAAFPARRGRPPGPRIALTCVVCSAPISVPPSRYRQGRGKTCSKRCQWVDATDGIGEYNRKRSEAVRASCCPAPLPVIRVPNRDVRIRFTGCCPHCGGAAFDVEWPNVDVDYPHVAHRATVFCLMCSRPLVALTIDGGAP